jgi:MFS family permease
MGNAEITNGRVAWRMVALICLGEFLAMTVWFSATAAAAPMTAEFKMTPGQTAWLTLAVQGGFVVGSLVSALTNLSDVLNARWLFGLGCLVAALANAAVTRASTPVDAVWLRMVSGAGLACVYPPGMKLAAGWLQRHRGAGLGVLIAALTAGGAFPHLVASLSGGNWRHQVLIASWLAMVGGAVVVLLVRDGPYVTSTAPFDPSAVTRVFRQRASRLATFGYLGHMWELYAMWTWVASYVTASLVAHGIAGAGTDGSLAAFVAIGSGSAGCVLAGLWADRFGKARTAAWSLMISGTCCALTAVAFDAPPWLLYALVTVWGFAVVADSAQYSALLAELSPPDHLGTALTIQTCCGFVLTMLSIELLPRIAAVVGWRWTFLALVPGPILGVLALLALLGGREVEAE